MKSATIAVAVVILAFVAAQPARADFDSGQRAWDAGNVAEALTQWRTAADAGDSRAMLALGRLHLQGLGVIQDYVEAHKWLNLAASRGEAAALAERDALAAKMTPAQIAKAQERAAAWRPGAGQGAGTAEASAQATPTTPAPDTVATRATAATPAPASASNADRPPPEAIREAQALLGALGYRPGPADGIWGRRTGAAYQAFLRDAGLPAAEILTPEALRAMRAIAQRKGAAEAGQATTVVSEADQAAPVAADASPPPPAPSAPEPAPVPPDALHQAAQAGDIEVLKAALAAGVDLDARDGQGWTALMHAVNKGYPLLVEPLLAAGAGVDVRAPDGATALFMAAAHGHTEIVALLMKADADISIRGPKGQTAVDVARARYGDADVARASGEDPAVLALLDGKTWAEDRRRERFAREWPRGKKFRDCAECPEMVVVPAGRFMMGSPESEKGRYSSEGPVHEVTIGEPFAVGVYEVTVEEFRRFVEGTGRSTPKKCRTYENGGWNERSGRSWKKPGFRQDGRHPVVCVSWDDAQAYVEWLSGKTGEAYRLLSESEWEYAARGGKGTSRYWGQGESGHCRHVNGADRALKRRYSRYNLYWITDSCDDGHAHTAPVGSFDANGYGLHDVMANVWEWVEDCWHEDYRGAPMDGSAWTAGGVCSSHVLRGGGWFTLPWDLRSAGRTSFTTAVRYDYLGFRVARTLTP